MIRKVKELEINYLNELSDYRVDINPFSNVIVYILDGQIIAYLDYSIIYERAEINYIFVLEKYRRQGIAYQLLQYVLENYELENITLEVNVHNEKAIALYKKIGFQIVSKRSLYYDGEDAYLMEVKL